LERRENHTQKIGKSKYLVKEGEDDEDTEDLEDKDKQ